MPEEPVCKICLDKKRIWILGYRSPPVFKSGDTLFADNGFSLEINCPVCEEKIIS